MPESDTSRSATTSTLICVIVALIIFANHWHLDLMASLPPLVASSTPCLRRFQFGRSQNMLNLSLCQICLMFRCRSYLPLSVLQYSVAAPSLHFLWPLSVNKCNLADPEICTISCCASICYSCPIQRCISCCFSMPEMPFCTFC